MPPAIEAWWHQTCEGADRPRLIVFLDAVINLPSERDPYVCILTAYLGSKKGLWDGEPDRIVRSIAAVHPHFWDNCPSNLKAAPGEVLRYVVRQGRPAHSKPGSQSEDSGNGFGASVFAQA
jgi:hypothetical protein